MYTKLLADNCNTILNCIEQSLAIAVKAGDLKKWDWLVDRWIEMATFLEHGRQVSNRLKGGEDDGKTNTEKTIK